MKTVSICLFLLNITIIHPTAQAKKVSIDEHTAHLLGHAHIDLVWLWTWEETIHDVAYHTFKGTLKSMDEMPGLTFSQSMATLYDAVEQYYPDLFQEIAARVKKGTWCPVGGMWSESDMNMPKGEALVRQLLYGKHYFKEKFGVDVRVGWLPDTFGHSANIPQIMKKAGIDFYVFKRCAPEDKPIFWWKGLDGSQILGYNPPAWYNVRLDDKIKDTIREAAEKANVYDFLYLYGAGDHGGGPRESDLETIRKNKDKKGFPELKFSTPQAYFDFLLQQKSDFPQVNGELNFIFRGCYTSMAKIKYNNRKAENLLLTAEKFGLNARLYRYRAFYPKRDLNQAWKIVLQNHFHDILPGSSIGPANDDVLDTYNQAFRRGQRALDFSLESIGANINTLGEGIPVVVYNPLSWDRTDAVTVDIAFHEQPKGLKVLDNDGQEIPSQIVNHSEPGNMHHIRLVFIAPDVPSVGYRLFRVVETEYPESLKNTMRVNEKRMINSFFDLVIDEKTGTISRIRDKLENRDILDGQGNVLQLLEDKSSLAKKAGPAWSLGLTGVKNDLLEPESVQVIESGPVRGKIRVVHRMNRSRFVQDIILYATLPRIEFQMQVDWHERDKLLKVVFPVNVNNGKATFEIPYGFVERPANGDEVPALDWIDYSNDEYGVSLLNDSKYGFDINKNIMRMSILRGPLYPDPRADEGKHRLSYALYPHSGTFKQALTIREGEAFNNPLIARVEMAHEGKAPVNRSFVQVEPNHVMLTAMKEEQGYWNRSIIIRLFEMHGKPTEATVTFPIEIQASETDLLEQEIQKVDVDDQKIQVKMKPFEIKTIKLDPKGGWVGW